MMEGMKLPALERLLKYHGSESTQRFSTSTPKGPKPSGRRSTRSKP